MTKERKLAIKMWEEIKERIPKWQKTSYAIPISERVVRYKRDFCIKHDLSWMMNCWFCAYITYCENCPLRSCAYGVYRDLIDNSSPLQAKIRACEYIISALSGNVVIPKERYE